MTYRDHTKVIRIGDRVIGGGNPILIQSMTNTPTEDVEATVAQILRLEEACCEIIRCTRPTEEAALAIGQIKKRIHIPLVISAAATKLKRLSMSPRSGRFPSGSASTAARWKRNWSPNTAASPRRGLWRAPWTRSAWWRNAVMIRW